jgi:hypothetical protein
MRARFVSDVLATHILTGGLGVETPRSGLLCDRNHHPHPATHKSNLTQGSLRGGVPPPQRGDWGSEPPDPGSAYTRENH